MFSFPLEKMVGGIFYEHGHRMIASTVGFLTIILALWTWRVDPRRWVRWLGVSALGAVILQGLLGGLTVLLLLPAPVSIGHAGLAQLFFCITVGLALFTSPGWMRTQSAADDRDAPPPGVHDDGTDLLPDPARRHDAPYGAGLAIPDFPLAFGQLVPPVWNAGIAVHFAHRIGAIIVTLAILATAGHVWYHHRSRPRAGHGRRPSSWFSSLTQVTLGAFVVWSGLQPLINTAHVVNGALVLATSLVLTLRSHRRLFATAPARTVVRGGHGVVRIGYAWPPRRRADPTHMKIDGFCRSRRHPREPRDDFVALAKPRLNLLVVASALAGYVMARRRHARRVAAALHCCRHRFGGGRRIGVQPGDRTRARRADAAHAPAPVA